MQKLCRYIVYRYDSVNIVQILSNSPLLQLQTPTGRGSNPINLQVGQTLQASVLSNVENRLVSLNIGNTVLTAVIEARLQAGQKLLLEVISAGEKPVLKIIQQPSQQAQVDAAIRHALPKQQPHQILFKQLDQLISSQATLQKLPERIQSEITRLIQTFPDRQTIIKPDVFRQAFKSSGLFLEAQLSQKTPPPSTIIQNDFKVALLRLQNVIQESGLAERPLNQTSTAVAKGDVNGLNSYLLATRNVTATPLRPPLVLTPVNTGFTTQPAASPAVGTAASPLNDAVKNDANTSLFNRAISAGTPIASSPLRPLSVSYFGLPGNTTQPGITNSVAIPTGTNISEAPFILPAQIPFRFQMTDNSRASEKFAKLDSLSKLLGLFLKDAESSLARIQLNQLNQLRTEPDQKPSWVFDIPVRTEKGTDLFEFRIEQEDPKKKAADETKIGWSIQVHFTLDSIGEIHSKISLFQKQVSITFWTDNKETQQAFKQHFNQLQQDLETAGLEIEQLSCLHGTPPVQKIDQPCKGILDEKI